MDDKRSSNTSASFNIIMGTFRLDYKYEMVNNFKQEFSSQTPLPQIEFYLSCQSFIIKRTTGKRYTYM